MKQARPLTMWHLNPDLLLSQFLRVVGLFLGTLSFFLFFSLPGLAREEKKKTLEETEGEWQTGRFMTLDGCHVVTLEVRNKVERLPKITFFLRYPPGMEPGEKVEGVFASVTHFESPKSVTDWIKRPAVQDGRFAFAETNRYAILSWTTNTMYSVNDSFTQTAREAENPRDEMEQSYRAWNRGIKLLGSEYGLPQKDFIIYGYSRGAQWSHRLVLRDPKRFAAVHIHINSSFAEPTPEAAGCLWLVTTGELEHGAKAAREFYLKALSMDYPILLRTYSNLGHSTSAEEGRLGLSFLEYATRKLKERQARLATLQEDAFARQQMEDLSVFRRSDLEEFVHPPFYGDFFNGDTVPAEKADNLPAANRIGLPDRGIASSWGYFQE
jgi:predicted esterase